MKKYEILWCVTHVDIRMLPDSIGFALPFLVGTPGEAKVLGVFPSEIGRGYARQLEKAMHSLGLDHAISFYTNEIAFPKRSVVYVIGRAGRPVGLASEPTVHMLDPEVTLCRCVVGSVYYEGLER